MKFKTKKNHVKILITQKDFTTCKCYIKYCIIFDKSIVSDVRSKGMHNRTEIIESSVRLRCLFPQPVLMVSFQSRYLCDILFKESQNKRHCSHTSF